MLLPHESAVNASSGWLPDKRVQRTRRSRFRSRCSFRSHRLALNARLLTITH